MPCATPRSCSGHELPSGDVAQVLKLALQALIPQLEKRRFSATTRPRPRPGVGPETRAGASRRPARGLAARQRTVHVREREPGIAARSGSSWSSITSRRSRGRRGDASDNLRLRCRAHNQYAAECTFGPSSCATSVWRRRRRGRARWRPGPEQRVYRAAMRPNPEPHCCALPTITGNWTRIAACVRAGAGSMRCRLCARARFRRGCSASAARWLGDTSPPHDSVFRFSLGSEPEIYDPSLAVGQPDGRVARLLFEGLTREDPQTLEPLPGTGVSLGDQRRTARHTYFTCAQASAGPTGIRSLRPTSAGRGSGF